MQRFSSPALSLLVLAALASFSGVASSHASVTLAPHRAVYDVALKEASDRSGITSMRGRIVYEFRGSACEGYTTNFRFVTQIGAQGSRRVTDQQTTTYEEGDASLFRFVTKTFVDEREDKHLAGTATRDGEQTIVRMSEPEPGETDLAPALFPTQHMIDLIRRANAGERFYEETLFDGSDEADRVMTTTVVIGPQKTPADDEPGSDIAEAIAQAPVRNVSIAYFTEAGEGGGEGRPEYRISFKMYDNGVTRSLELDYGDFVLSGALEDLEIFPAEPCN